MSSETVEYIGWSGGVRHNHVAIEQLLEGEVVLVDVTREISIISTQLEESLRPVDE